MPGDKYRRLEEYLKNLRDNRNTEEGNGAHFSMFFTEEELDRRIKEAVTLYIYVTGSYLPQLESKYDDL